MLQLLSSSLRAGHSISQGLHAAVDDAVGPMSAELNKALLQARLGLPLTDALAEVAERMRSKDFAWVVMVIKIQRDVGGNLGEVLTNVAGTLRERERVRRQVKTLSAEGRLSAWVLGGLPVAFVAYLIAVRPNTSVAGHQPAGSRHAGRRPAAVRGWSAGHGQDREGGILMLLVLGLLAVFVGLAVAVLSVGVLATERTSVDRALATIESIGGASDLPRHHLHEGFADRVVRPVGRWLTSVGQRLTPSERTARINRRVLAAGMEQTWTVDRILAIKALLMLLVGGGSALLLLLAGRPSWALVAGPALAALGWFAPDLAIYQKAYNRRERIQRGLADVLDLLTVSVEAGMGFDAALGNGRPQHRRPTR